MSTPQHVGYADLILSELQSPGAKPHELQVFKQFGQINKVNQAHEFFLALRSRRRVPEK